MRGTGNGIREDSEEHRGQRARVRTLLGSQELEVLHIASHTRIE